MTSGPPTRPAAQLRVGLIGLGTIGSSLAEMVRRDEASSIRIVGALVRDPRRDRDVDVRQVDSLEELLKLRPDVIAEAAGHEALAQHGPGCLSASLPLVLLSVGALADPAVESALRSAAEAGGVSAWVASGGVGALDLIASAAQGGLERVVHAIVKPPPALGLAPGTERELFRGSAREAAREYPQNANVAAAVALAGLGLDRSEVVIASDPAATVNRQELDVHGSFGRFQLKIENRPSATNPRTSAVVAMSLKHALERRCQAIVIG